MGRGDYCRCGMERQSRLKDRESTLDECSQSLSRNRSINLTIVLKQKQMEMGIVRGIGRGRLTSSSAFFAPRIAKRRSRSPSPDRLNESRIDSRLAGGGG